MHFTKPPLGAVIMAALIAIVLVKPAHAQQSAEPPTEEEPSTEIVVVTAPALDDMVRSFVGEISVAGQVGQLGRWDRSICPGVAGMRTRYAQALIDRIALIAHQVGLEVGEPGCRPNAMIFVTEDSDALAADIVRHHGTLVSRRNRAGNTRGREALEAFAETPRAVRWWHVSRSVTSDGFQVRQGEQTTVRSIGRLGRGTREDFDRVLVIIDARRIDGIRFGSVADYVAMVVLAQLDPDADTVNYTTILNLFGGETNRPTTITAWDLAYLEGLYGAVRDADDGRQERDIRRRMRTRVPDEGGDQEGS